MGNPNHDPRNGEFTSGAGGTAEPPDMASVNIPFGKRRDLNSQIDQWKREQASAKKAERAVASEHKQQAQSLLKEHGAQLLEKYGAKMGPGLKDELARMARFEPTKFIVMATKFKAGK